MSPSRRPTQIPSQAKPAEIATCGAYASAVLQRGSARRSGAVSSTAASSGASTTADCFERFARTASAIDAANAAREPPGARARRHASMARSMNAPAMAVLRPEIQVTASTTSVARL